ncbi:MAG TPA: hypothetical protein DEB10_14795 [Ruminococcaceae bacterium]|jgi:hypothetical protein|nr:hypothetical protein [Oscillospiraceae bacterium]
MKIINKVFGVIALVAMALEILLSVAAFRGETFCSSSIGISFATLAICMLAFAADSLSKPKHPWLRFTFQNDDGSKEIFVMRADRGGKITKSLEKPYHELNIAYMESAKGGEALNEQAHRN